MKLLLNCFFFFLFCAVTAQATDISKPLEETSPNKCLSCNIPAPTNFIAAEVGSTWVRLTWTQSNLMSNRVRTYRASDNYLLNTTIVPASASELVVSLPSNTECYSVINAICEDGSNSSDEGISAPFTTIIVDLIVSGYAPGSGSPQCTISVKGQGCNFGNSAIFPFLIKYNPTGTSRTFGVERTGATHYRHHLASNNEGQDFKFYCDGSANPTCYEATTIVVKYNNSVAAVLELTQSGAATNTLICTQLAPFFSVQQIIIENGGPNGGRSEMVSTEGPLSLNYTNPIQDVLSLNFNREIESSADVRLFSANGQSVLHQNLAEGQKTYELSTAALAPGFYFLRVETEGLTETMKVFKTE